MTGRLNNKVAVVTGAAPRGEGVGNGMATAILFAREGAKVVLVNRSAERARKLLAQIRDEGGEAAVFSGDVTKMDVTEEMAAFAVERYGRLDILHNNVGFGAAGTPETVTLDNWNNVLEANLTTTMLCTKACLPWMKKSGGGSIIMVSSIAGALGLTGSPGAVAYSTAKARVARLHDIRRCRLRHPEYSRQLYRRRLSAHTNGRPSRPGGPRAPPNDGSDANRGHCLGHRLWRGISCLRRVTLGHWHPAAYRRRPHRVARLASLGQHSRGMDNLSASKLCPFSPEADIIVSDIRFRG